MMLFAINDSDWSGQHSVLGTTRMHASTQTLPPAKGLVPRLVTGRVGWVSTLPRQQRHFCQYRNYAVFIAAGLWI